MALPQEIESSAPTMAGDVPLPRENVYGHVQRLHWFRRHLSPAERAVEFGCGTGYMITLPMRAWGYQVTGVDVDGPSIEYGRELLDRAGLDPAALEAKDLADVRWPLDVVIASEVLEHLDDATLETSLGLIHSKLRPGGRILVTVPNGYGWFELEAFAWERLGVSRLAERRARRNTRLGQAKRQATGNYVADACSSTLANSPHVQRFTFRGIRSRLEHAGFDVIDATGSVLVAGPISDLALTGFERFMSLNRRLGHRLPWIASGFYLAGVKTPA